MICHLSWSLVPCLPDIQTDVDTRNCSSFVVAANDVDLACFSSTLPNIAGLLHPKQSAQCCRAPANGITVQRWRKDARALEREEEVCIVTLQWEFGDGVSELPVLLRSTTGMKHSLAASPSAVVMLHSLQTGHLLTWQLMTPAP